MSPTQQLITGVILAGGKSSRMPDLTTENIQEFNEHSRGNEYVFVRASQLLSRLYSNLMVLIAREKQ